MVSGLCCSVLFWTWGNLEEGSCLEVLPEVCAVQKPNILIYWVLPNEYVVSRVKEGMSYQTLQGSPPGYGYCGQAKESPGMAFKEALYL